MYSVHSHSQLLGCIISGAGGGFWCSEHVANILPSGPLTWFKVEHTCRLANYADSFRVRVYNQASAGVQKS